MVKTLIEQNKTSMMEMIKSQFDINETPGSSNLVNSPAEIQQQSSKIKVTKFSCSYFKVVRLGRL